MFDPIDPTRRPYSTASLAGPPRPSPPSPELGEGGRPVSHGEIVDCGEYLDTVRERALAADVLLEGRRRRAPTVHLQSRNNTEHGDMRVTEHGDVRVTERHGNVRVTEHGDGRDTERGSARVVSNGKTMGTGSKLWAVAYATGYFVEAMRHIVTT